MLCLLHVGFCLLVLRGEFHISERAALRGLGQRLCSAVTLLAELVALRSLHVAQMLSTVMDPSR